MSSLKIKLNTPLMVAQPTAISLPTTTSFRKPATAPSFNRNVAIMPTKSAFRYDENGDYLLPNKMLVTERHDGFGFKLAKPLANWETAIDNLQYPLVAEQKLDGVRCQILLLLNRAKRSIRAWAYTRNGNRIRSIDHIVNEMESLFDYESAINSVFYKDYDCLSLDGELQMHTPNAPFRVVNGLVNRSATDDETRQLHFHIYNMYYLHRSLRPMCQVDKLRQESLLRTLGYKNPCHFGTISESHYVLNVQGLRKLISDFKSKGYEGMIVKTKDETTSNTRTTEWQKIKFKRRGTFRLVDIIDGDGKCFGTTGAIVVADSHGTRSRVGTGFTDAERDELYALVGECHRRLILVEIEYLALTKGSLREAVYCGLRKDIEPSESAIDEFKDRGE